MIGERREYGCPEVPAGVLFAGRDRSPRIFVVDDEPIIAETLANILRHQGFNASFFIDPRAVLAAAELETPDLLISDVVMPGLSGIELALELRRRWPDCGVLLFSGHSATAELLEKARRDGYDFAFVAKPIHPADLLAAASGLAKRRKSAA